MRNAYSSMHQYIKYLPSMQFSDKYPFSPTFSNMLRPPYFTRILSFFYKTSVLFSGKSPQFSTKYFVDNVDIFVYKFIFPRFSVFFLWITLRSYPLLFCPGFRQFCALLPNFTLFLDRTNYLIILFVLPKAPFPATQKTAGKRNHSPFLQSQFSQKFFDDRKRIRRFF